MSDKIDLGIRTDNLTKEYNGDSKNTIESFDAKKSIDEQLNELSDREKAKGELRDDLSSIDKAAGLKTFLENTNTNEGYNKYITTYASHISINIGNHEYAFKAEDESTRIAIHTALVDFFRTQVIETQLNIYKESDDYKDIEKTDQATALVKKNKELEEEFDAEKFEIDIGMLKTNFKIKETDKNKKESTPTENKEPNFFEKLRAKAKIMLNDPLGTIQSGSVGGKLLAKVSAGLIGIISTAKIGKEKIGEYANFAADLVGGTAGNYIKTITNPEAQTEILAANKKIQAEKQAPDNTTKDLG